MMDPKLSYLVNTNPTYDMTFLNKMNNIHNFTCLLVLEDETASHMGAAEGTLSAGPPEAQNPTPPLYI